MYIKIMNGVVDKYPYSYIQLQADNPGTSFPANPTAALLAEWGVFAVITSTEPSVDYTKNVTEVDPVYNGSEWIQTWLVTDATEEEKTQRTKDKEISVREERNKALAETDWTQLADAPVNSLSWANYRQQLRDITDQAGFPWEVTWPTKPQA